MKKLATILTTAVLAVACTSEAPVQAQPAESKTLTTVEQVREFQKKNGLAADGKVGPQTRKAMAAAGYTYAPAKPPAKAPAKTTPKGTGKPALMIKPATKP